jgi:AraC-like DNA-binding protein
LLIGVAPLALGVRASIRVCRSLTGCDRVSFHMRPAGHLRPFVSSYIDFDMAGWPAGRHRGLPDGSLALVLSIGPPPVLHRAGRGDVAAAATVAGLQTEPLDIFHDGTQRGVQLELTPAGARALLGVPAAALVHGVFAFDDVVGCRAGELAERVAGAPGPAGRVAALDAVLSSWLTDASPPQVVEAMWRRLVVCAGSIPISAIAAEIGMGRRHLSQLVRAELGLTPKTAARIVRFAQARRFLVRGQTSSLSETAAACRYHDQAHLAHDWKQFVGCTPGEWMSQELPFLQDRGPAADAG